MSLQLGIVVATYPEGNSIDVLLRRDGSRLSNVQVMSYSASSNTGMCDLPDIGAQPGLARWDPIQPVTRYVRALLDDVDGVPICVGFLLPQETQMTFQRKNFKVDRHTSDVYSTINATGDMETSHPSGSYFRFGATTPHEDLTGQDFDKLWAIKNNVGAAPYLHFVLANAGAVVATFDIDPSGNVSLTHNGNLTVNTTGNLSATVTGSATATVGGTTSINSTGNVELTAPQITLNGVTIINGVTTINGALTQGTGSGGGSATMAGPLAVTGDVTANGKSLDTHVHSGVSSGSSNSGPPV